MKQKETMLNTLLKENKVTMSKLSDDEIGNDHVSANIETPLRDDAFEMSDTKKIEKIEIGMHHVFSYSQQEFGKLKTTQPALHAVMQPIRENIVDYCSGCLGDLKGKARKIIKKENPTPRAPNLDFSDWLMDKEKCIIPEMQAKCKTAKKRGDATADEARLREAITAFLAKWKP
jgi:hypothetical protein